MLCLIAGAWRGGAGELSDAHVVVGAGLDGSKCLPILCWVVSSTLNHCFDLQVEGWTFVLL